MTPQHQAARRYAQLGWKIHPVIGKSQPCLTDWPNRGSCDLEMIDEWWSIWPDANPALHPEVNGMCVIDTDTYKGAIAPAISCVRAKTPRGGTHDYFAGSLPTTVGKLGHGIDTRGVNGYVLLPGSITEDGAYEWITEPPTGVWDLSEIPQEIADCCARVMNEPRKPRSYDPELVDRPKAIDLFKQYLSKVPVMGPEESGDDYAIACRALDLGLSAETGIALCTQAGAESEEWVRERFKNAERYRQNEPACDAPPTPTELYGNFAARLSPQELSDVATDNDWVPHDPRDPKDMPEIEFYDEAHTIPKIPTGCVKVYYGRRGDHKTNVVLSVLERCAASRILYAAGEGAYGLERDRIAARNTFDNRLKLLPRVPLFSDPSQVHAFIEGTNSLGWRPEIVVLDTMTNALSGEDTNTDIAASYLSDNGPVGIIRREWNCVVILIAHAGKDASRGVKGSSGFEDNADVVELVEAFKDTRTIRTTLTKMRDAPEDVITYWKYNETGVPVPEPITKAEFDRSASKDLDTSPIGSMVKSYLRLHGHHARSQGLLSAELADAMTEQEHGARPEDVVEQADWDTSKAKWLRALVNAKKKSWYKECTSETIEPGGTKMILRWFCPPTEDTEF